MNTFRFETVPLKGGKNSSDTLKARWTLCQHSWGGGGVSEHFVAVISCQGNALTRQPIPFARGFPLLRKKLFQEEQGHASDTWRRRPGVPAKAEL